MSIITMINELIRFIKNYALKILFSALLIGLATAGLRYYTGGFENEEIATAYEDLYQRYQQEPAEFQIILTNPEGMFFSNSFVIDEFLGQDEMVEKAEAISGIKFNGWLEKETLLELYKTGQFRGGLASLRDGSTEIITVRVALGKSAEENLKIAQAYQQIINEEKLPFLESYKVSLVSEASIGEKLPEEKFPNLATINLLESSNRITPKSAIIFGVAGLIGGAILTTLCLFLMRIFKAKIAYAFDYSWGMDDTHIIYDRNSRDASTNLNDFINIPKLAHRFVVIQGNPDKLLPAMDQQDLIYVTNVQDITANVQEIVIIIYSNQTEKAWFNDQYDMAKLYKVPVKVIQII